MVGQQLGAEGPPSRPRGNSGGCLSLRDSDMALYTYLIVSMLLLRGTFELFIRLLRSQKMGTLSNSAHLSGAAWHATHACACVVLGCTWGKVVYDAFVRDSLDSLLAQDTLTWFAVSTSGTCGVYLTELCIKKDLSPMLIIHHVLSMIGSIGVVDGVFPLDILFDPIMWKMGILFGFMSTWFVLTYVTLASYRIISSQNSALQTLLVAAMWNEVVFKAIFQAGSLIFLAMNTHRMQPRAAAFWWTAAPVFYIAQMYTPYGWFFHLRFITCHLMCFLCVQLAVMYQLVKRVLTVQVPPGNFQASSRTASSGPTYDSRLSTPFDSINGPNAASDASGGVVP